MKVCANWKCRRRWFRLSRDEDRDEDGELIHETRAKYGVCNIWSRHGNKTKKKYKSKRNQKNQINKEFQQFVVGCIEGHGRETLNTIHASAIILFLPQ